MATIFLSHSSHNDTLASALEQWLIANGFDDLFVDHTNIRSGDKWSDSLRRAKASCRVVLCLVTPEWLDSDECYGEFKAAWYLGRRIIPLLCLTGTPLDNKQASHLARVLAEDQGADIAKAGAPGALNLNAAPAIAEPLKAGLRASGALAKIGLDPLAFEVDTLRRSEPFPGLASFGDDDADAAIFFGRGPEIAQSLEDLREMRANGDRRAYAIQGASGSGKSSLMKAGLLPRLRRENGWFVLRAFRPGADPLFNFADAIARTASDWGDARAAGTIRDELRQAWAVKADLRVVLDAVIGPLKRSADRPKATVLIALDQAEELARAGGETVDSADSLGAYLKAAAGAVTEEGEAPPYSLIFTVRSDSFAELQTASRFDGLITRTADIRTLPLYRFSHAIEQPAARYGVEIEPELIEALIEDAGSRDALPLLAFTLQRLWQQYQSEKRIVLANYNSVGKLSGLIEDAAERALRGIDPLAPQGPLEIKVSADQDRRAGHAFVPALAQVNEQSAAIRRVASLAKFNEDERVLLGQFDRWRLVTTHDDLVEVTHEALFREWPRFKRWLVPEKARLEVLRSIEGAATAWDTKGRQRDDLTHRGKRLIEARALDQERDYKAQLDGNPTARAYLTAAIASEHRRTLVATSGAALLAVILLTVAVFVNTAYSDQIKNGARVSFSLLEHAFTSQRELRVSAQQYAQLQSVNLALRNRVADSLDLELKAKNKQAGWTIAEYNLALGQYSAAKQSAALALLDATRLQNQPCWPEYVVDYICHTGATAWALDSLAASGIAASPASVGALLDLQRKDGWWPMYFNLSNDASNASTYATAWALMAISAQEQFADLTTQRRIETARRTATEWLIATRVANRYRWKDYPFNGGAVVSESISALTVIALNRASKGADLEPLNRGWLRELPIFPKAVGTLERSDITLGAADSNWLHDKTGYTVVPWVSLSIVSCFGDGDTLGRAKARVYLDNTISGLSSYDTKSGLDYLAADLLYSTGLILKEIKSTE
jgi:hypothetical protein